MSYLVVESFEDERSDRPDSAQTTFHPLEQFVAASHEPCGASAVESKTTSFLLPDLYTTEVPRDVHKVWCQVRMSGESRRDITDEVSLIN